MTYWTEKYGCWSCTLDCGGKMEVREGPYKCGGHKVEYETGAAFGNMALNTDFTAIIKCNDLCNRYGFDSISAGCTVAFAIECYMHGLLTPEQADHLDLRWGNAEAMVKLLEKIGERTHGIGEHMADGVRQTAKWVEGDAHEYAIHIHGQEIPMHDPKFEPGLAVTYVMDATPGRHTQGSEGAIPPGLGLQRMDRSVQEGRGELHKQCVCYNHVSATAGICNFGMGTYDYHAVPELLTAVTGEGWSLNRCLLAGERIAVIRHLFNLREGLNPLEWDVPKRLLGIPQQKTGPNANFTVDLPSLIQDYLKAMEWDQHTTWPSRERLATLGLLELVEAGLVPA
jgi:aldehyde:ferredoxin oxidoreductase